MNSIPAALSGIQATTSRLDNAANNIANMNTPGFVAQEPVQSSGPAGTQVAFSPTTAPADSRTSNVDLPTQMVEFISDRYSVKANAAVIRTQDAMIGSLLDIRA